MNITPVYNPIPTGPGGDARTSESQASSDTFLRLLVAQLRTQNPLDPQKGTEFVTQLAQFTTLEQLIGIRAELAAMRRAAEQPAERPQTPVNS